MLIADRVCSFVEQCQETAMSDSACINDATKADLFCMELLRSEFSACHKVSVT